MHFQYILNIKGIASIILAYSGYYCYGNLFEVLSPGSKLICYNMNLYKKISIYATYFYLFGKLHRENDLPAVIYKDNTKLWFINDKPHRDGDLPAVISGGREEWYKYGHRHRDDDKPAVYDDGLKKWYYRGKLHRLNGPAIEWNGNLQYYINDILVKEIVEF
jgi:hypothetical protein